MKRNIKIVMRVFCCLLLAFLCISFLSQCSLMYSDKKNLSSDNLSYYNHTIFRSCFAGNYTWPSEEEYAELDIPDECEGYRVTSLGGYIGSGGPCPFMVQMPDTRSIYSEGTLPDNAKIEQYYLAINIGKHLRKVEIVEMKVYYNLGSNRFAQILVTVNCVPENPYFYSENGKLYNRLDHSLVEEFFYYSDYSMN